MQRILFQGDSITDAKRNKEDDKYGGMGYPTLVAAQMGFEHPQCYEFLNRGVSGNRVVDLLARVKQDIINLNPQILSILVGVNDVWHEISSQNGVDSDQYEVIYDLLVSQIKKALPEIKIMILEPFVLKGAATEESWDLFRKEVEERSVRAERIAKKHRLIFVPLMGCFDEMAQKAPAAHWLIDGVHPTAAGHELIKREWIKAFITMTEK